MATRDFASVTSALATLMEEQVISQVNRSVVLAQILGVVPAEGKNVTWDVKFGTDKGAAIADGVDNTTYNVDTKVPATLDYAEYTDAFSLTGRAMSAAMATGNPRVLANLFLEEAADSVERLADGIGDGIYNGSGATDNIWGLYASVSPIGSTGIYANVNRSTYAQWKGTVTDAASAPVSFDMLRSQMSAIYVASGEQPDVIVCDATQHDKIGQLFGANRRYIDEVRRSDGTVIKLSGGYKVLEFDGVPIIRDRQHPASKITFLNSRHTRLRQLPAPPADITGQMGAPIVIGGTPEEQLGPGRTKLSCFMIPFAKTGNAHKFGLYCMPQLQVRRCNSGGYITNLG